MRRARMTTRTSAISLPSIWASAFEDWPLSPESSLLGGAWATGPFRLFGCRGRSRRHPLSVPGEARAQALERAHLRLVERGKLGIDLFELLDDGRRHDEAREPFVVGGRDVPRRVLGGGAAHHLFVGLLI